jgi:hypothetical protein
MKWYEIEKHRPPYGELIWIWDASENKKGLIRYRGSKENWIETKDRSENFPIWAHLNDEEMKDD